MFLFKPKSEKPQKEEPKLNQDLAIITQMNHEFALSLDLNETLKTALEVITKRINAQAANIFLIEEKKQVLQNIASLGQDHLDEYEIPVTQGVMGKAIQQKNAYGLETLEKIQEKLQNSILI